MSFLIYLLIPVYVIVCVFLILVVLLQQGKGADVASAFGASSSQTTFGARGAATVLERVTTWAFVAFSVLAIGISLIQSRPKSSVLSSAAAASTKPAAAPVKPVTPPSTGAAAPVTAAVPSTAANVDAQPASATAAPLGVTATAGAEPVSPVPATSAPAAADAPKK